MTRSFDTTPGHAYALAGGCLIDVYATLPDPRHLDDVEAALRAQQAPVAHLILLTGPALRPPPEAFRQRVIEATARVVDRTACRATVIELTGMIGATARAVMAGIFLAERSRFPQTVCGSVDDALEWMVTKAPSLVVAEVRAGIASARVRAAQTG